jgi:ABC-2 type transport system permease protein
VKLRLYGHIIKIRFVSSLEYRTELIYEILTSFALILCVSYLWRALYGNNQGVYVISLDQMLIFMVIAQLLNLLLFSDLPEQINDKIYTGSISIDLIRPFHLWAAWVAEDIGTAISRVIIKGIPLLLFASLIIAVPKPANVTYFLLFSVSTVLSYVLMTCISYMVGLTSIWYMDFGNFGAVARSIIVFLSGSIIPIWFFPDWFQEISSYLPFIYIYQFPIGIYIGKFSGQEILAGLLTQFFWIICGLIGSVLLWRAVKNKIVIQGG